MYRLTLAAIATIVLLLVLMMPRHAARVAYDSTACAGPRLSTVASRENALEAGYTINQRYVCIDRASFDAVNAQRQAAEQRQAQALATERALLAGQGASDFAQQRHGFNTAVSLHDAHPLPLPEPPAALFVRSDYRNPQHYVLPGFVSPDPHDGLRHAAIIWITGGDSNSLGDFWTAGPAANDQSVQAFREAGLVMAFPTLRGGNGSDSAKELFLGEVDDILAAAADHVPHVQFGGFVVGEIDRGIAAGVQHRRDLGGILT